jgi:MFS family permease
MQWISKYNTLSYKRWLYVILGIIIMMCLGTVYSWSVLRLPIEKAYNIGRTQSGLPYMVSLATYALFMLITGRHIDRHQPRTIVIIGALLVAIGWFSSAYAPNIYVLTLTYGVLVGAGLGIAYGAPMTVVARWFPEKKGLAVGLVLGGFGLSPLITAPLARHLIEINGLSHTFKTLGIIFVVVISLLAIPLKYPDQAYEESMLFAQKKKSRVKPFTTKEMIHSRNFIGLYINFIIGTMIGLMLIGMTSSVGVQLIQMQPKTVALFMSIFAIFNGLGRPIFGWLTDQLDTKRAMLLSFSLILFAALLMLTSKEGSHITFLIAFSIFWFNLGAWLAIAPTSTLAMYGTKNYSQNYGVIFTAYGFGAILGVTGSGLLLDLLNDYHSIFYFVIGLCVLGILSTLLTASKSSQA